MSTEATGTITMSSKGQIVLPKAIRDDLHWVAGTKLTYEQRPDGVLVKAAPVRKQHTIDDLIGIAKYTGPKLSDEEIERRIAESLAEEVRAGRW